MLAVMKRSHSLYILRVRRWEHLTRVTTHFPSPLSPVLGKKETALFRCPTGIPPTFERLPCSALRVPRGPGLCWLHGDRDGRWSALRIVPASEGAVRPQWQRTRKAQPLLQDGSASCLNLHPDSHHHVALGVDCTRQNVLMAVTNKSQVSVA